MTTAPTTPDPAPRRRGRRRTVALLAGTAALTIAGTALTTGALGPGAAPAAADGLAPFEDCTQVRDWYSDAMRPLFDRGWWGGFALPGVAGGDSSRPVARAAEESAGAGAAPGPAVGAGSTGTNLQEEGVDEPDTVKTHPDRPGLVLTTTGDRLLLVDVSGGAPREVGAVQVPGLAGWPVAFEQGGGVEPQVVPVPASPGTAEILLAGDRVVLLSQGWAELAAPGADGQRAGEQQQDQDRSADVSVLPVQGIPTTTTTLVDVSDPTAPRVVSRQEIEGSLVGARLSGGVVRVVTSSTPQVVDEAALDAMQGADFLPSLVFRDGDGAVTTTEPALGCGDLQHTTTAAGAGVLTVRTLDPTSDGDPVVDTDAVASDGDLVYASPERLYVATTRGGWAAWRGGAEPDDPDAVTTELHGFDTATGAATTYLASGEVDGYLLGRWALSARDGRLRVATTTGQMWTDPQSQAEPSQSWVTVLAERDGDLEQVGQVGGLGVGETIRSVRWFDDVATVVTFRQTDPLYVVDLSDPTAPTVTGELKVPGYSAYLHPVGEDRLLGVGQDATAEGGTTGVLVQTFDLSDRTAPTQLSTWTERNTWTSVEGDSRQFTYVPGRRTALLPMETVEGGVLQAITVGEDGTLADGGRFVAGSQNRWGYVVRAIVVGDRVVVLSGAEEGGRLSVLDLDGLTRLGSVSLG